MSKKSQLCFCFFLMLKRVRVPTRRISWCDTCFASMYLSFFWNHSLRIEFGYAISAYSAHTTGRDVTETTWSVDCMPDATWHPGRSTFSLWFIRVTAMVLLRFWAIENWIGCKRINIRELSLLCYILCLFSATRLILDTYLDILML